jgi:hypothetical protein
MTLAHACDCHDYGYRGRRRLCCSRASRLAINSGSKKVDPVTLPSGRAAISFVLTMRIGSSCMTIPSFF